MKVECIKMDILDNIVEDYFEYLDQEIAKLKKISEILRGEENEE